MSDASITTRCGYCAIIGRPNVGKSTLINRLLGQKLSITAPRPQTTRHCILGIKTEHGVQTLFVDTPGVHRDGARAMNRYLNRIALSMLHDVHVIVLVVEGTRWTEEDEDLVQKLQGVSTPVILAINKVDKVADKRRLLPHIETLTAKFAFAEVVPLSARKGDNLAALENAVSSRLPEAAYQFPEDQITDRSERFLAAELVREKLTRRCGQELPYALTVEIERFADENGVAHIDALIWVERPGHKAIVIGAGGEQLKEIGSQARQDMEKMFQRKVFLRLWVKVKEGWSDDERALRSLGYDSGML